MQLLRKILFLFLSAGLALAAGCSGKAPMVYVLASEQEVSLHPSVSAAKVQKGEQIVLRVQRRAVGQWKQIPRDQLTPGQCWLYVPPPELEPEVADKVEWEIIPDRGVQLDPTFRMDHTRIAVPVFAGTYKLTPYSPVTCEKDRVVQGPTIEIEVT
ncbi:MAG TPA: hypothetical protein VH814_22965 [Steroidobacteraceae bacterium]|jgi:hypothetical protein